jgi:acyl transferase domain-containing protein/acyl carrier protein
MDIAIIGIAFRFPGANDCAMFWKNLVERKSAVTEVPSARWDWRQMWGDPTLEVNKTFSKWAGFIDDVDAFDHEFFSYLPKVVTNMDPQQRIMLELAWASLEDAGIPPSSLRGHRVGVFAGVTHHDYKELLAGTKVPAGPYHYTGTATVVVPNRVSHFFGFRGPSLPVDTACSSSLNAIHLAIQSFESDECELALVGGISLILNPARHISVSKMGTLSPTGSCKTLDDSADGYVRGEGAGFFVLKPLEKALSDKDLIYGVIKGSAVNHCGKTHTLSYPSAEAQADVIVAAHQRAGVPISSVSFVELHGTGTAKGDPIEFQGLCQAFARLANEQGIALEDAYCGLSSAKTNLGHLEAAAGMAGVAKVLLAFRHRQLPGFHNFRKLNSRVTIEHTPFFILDDTKPWPLRDDGVPLRAGVSSFGFGGTNAHLVLEEPPAPRTLTKSGRKPTFQPCLIALSAKTSGALQRRKNDLSAWLHDDAGEHSLADIARALLLERDHLALRFACVVDDLEQLATALSVDANKPTHATEQFDEERQTSLNTEAMKILARQSRLKRPKRREALQSLAALFQDGADIDWGALYPGSPARRVRLPVYAFERNRFWLPETDAVVGDSNLHRTDEGDLLHPLLHRNAVTLDTKRFRSIFDGSEYFLADHVVRGERMLPGVAYLEMAYAAIMQMFGHNSADRQPPLVRLADIVWLRPLTVGDQSVEVEVELTPVDAAGNDQHLDFEFRISIHKNGIAAQTLCRGLGSTESEWYVPEPNLAALKAGALGTWRSADAIYAEFSEQGLEYGPGHKLMQDLHFMADYGLARIDLPLSMHAGAQAYVLHPGVADAALQSAVAFISATGDGDRVQVAIPFALDNVWIRRAPIGSVYAYVRHSGGSSDKIDIDILDDTDGGAVCAAFRSLSLRPIPPVANGTASAAAAKRIETIDVPISLADTLYVTEWHAQAPTPIPAPIHRVVLVGPQRELDWVESLLRRSQRLAGTHFDRIVVLEEDEAALEGTIGVRPGVLEDYKIAAAAIVACDADLQRVLLVPSQIHHHRYAERIATSAQQVFALVQAIFGSTKTARLLQLAPPLSENVEHIALGGLFKTLRIEKPSFSGRVLDGVMADGNHGRLADIVIDEFLCKGTAVDIRYRNGVREVRGFAAIGARAERPADHATAQFREGGVYLITGGLGALGRIVARYLCSRYRSHVYLTGRSAPDEAQQAMIAEIAALGGTASYVVCDVVNRDDVRRAIGAVHADGRRLNGVLHSAGLIADAFMLRKSAEEFARVIAPKTLGTWNLDEETRDEPLDMFVFFSSVAGALGNVGQCDYAYGNAFEDAFAHARDAQRRRNERRGSSLSINWPFWLNGGMRLGEAEIQAVRRSFGLVPLHDEPGLDALEFGLAHGRAQMLVMPGDAGRVREVLGASLPQAAAVAAKVSDIEGDPAVVSAFLAATFSRQLNIPEAIVSDKSFMDYGFDSVVMIELVALLEKTFGSLPKTLFFECPNLGALAAYFIAFHPIVCSALGNASATESRGVVDAAGIANYLSSSFAQQLRSDTHFETDKSFTDYGFDSVVMIELIASLEKTFGTLPKTLFFECPNLGALAGYFLENHAEAFARVLGTETEQSEPAAEFPSAPPAAGTVAPPSSRAAAFAVQYPAIAEVAADDAIAIIGLAGRYPQADTLDAFWDNLRLGRDCIEEIPADRPEIAAKFRFRPGEPVQAHSYAHWGGFLRDVDRFDAAFFNISPKEAENIDPNERLFLEIAAHAIEDAGYTPDTLASRHGPRENRVGVYVGLMWGDYQLHGVDRAHDDWVTPHSFYWAIPNRVSYQFNFSGPSLALDTACSSSLTAIHLACQAIRQGEIEVAIAGASNLSLHPNKYNLLSDLQFLSSDGRCRAFGEGGNGYVPGEGVGAVVLKSLSNARRDGDQIYAVIRGSAINHGGKAAGFTVPNPKRQAALIQEALETAGVDPRHISYVEAHGTGTSLGDPVEISGLTKAFAQTERQYCAIGSVKANIGHLEAASGIAGLTKVLLQLRHRMLAPSIHTEPLNPLIDFADGPFRVQRSLQPWLRPVIERKGVRTELPRLAGVSSFGAGGANGHLVIEEYIDDVRADVRADAPAVIVLSARKETALRAMALGLDGHLRANPDIGIQDAAYTLQIGRVPMECRVAFVAMNRDALLVMLRAYVESGALDAGAWSGHRDSGRRDPAVAARVKSATVQVADWLAQRNLISLAGAWVDGVEIDWATLYVPGRQRRVSLPGYPYDRQRYWVPDAPAVGSGAAALHPLIDANVSTLDEQAFAKTFRGDEFFLRDHRLGDNRILPGVVYLEMAIQAARLAAPGRRVAGLRDMHWHKPILVGADPLPMRIGLMPGRDAVLFELYAAEDPARPIYAQGTILLEDLADNPAGDGGHHDLAAIRSRCRSVERAEIDAAFAGMGFVFGDSFRVFERLHYSGDEALAELRLPSVAGVRHDDFALPPGLLDGALRACLGIGGLAAGGATIRVPVRLGQIDLLEKHRLGERAYVHARRAQVAGATDEEVYDLDLCDSDGTVRIRIRSLVSQAAPQLALIAAHAPAPVEALAPPLRNTPSNAPHAIAVALLQRLLSDVTKLRSDQIDPNAPLENYGIDSLMIAALNRDLESRFGEIPKTLFFEHQEIAGVADYFAEQHADALQTMASEFPTSGFASAVNTETTNDRSRVLARLHAQMREAVGDEAADCTINTPITAWPLDPLAAMRLMHALAEDFEQVDAFAPYRHATLADWAAELRLKPGCHEALDAELISASRLPIVGDRRSLPAQPRMRGAHRFAAARDADEDIAIVGLSGHYPGADDLHGFWGNLAAGRDGISEIPLSRWDHARYFNPDRSLKGTVYSKWGGFLEGVDRFDARFFNMTAREAEITDPQERVFLQTAWECFEDACYTRQSLKARAVGVFVGVMWANYAQIDVSDEQLKYGRPSTPFASIANRVSYFMNLNGPSLALDTMCSSSLTAIHLACRAINNDDCEMALAGGVNLILHPHKYQQLSSSQFLSSDGRCRAFGDGGDGYVPGEGAGAVLLKRLSQAVADGDHIYGVIKATAINHGGKTNGYTVPNQPAQTSVIGKALQRSGWDPRSIDYIEAHGTGTSLGDPIEIAGLTRAFAKAAVEVAGSGTQIEAQRCCIGSIKSNFGHLESAAAIAGLTKILMQFRYGALAPSLHSATLNPNIDFTRSPFRVVQCEEAWPAEPRPRRAGLSSFGAGGSNAHCLIEDYPQSVPVRAAGRPALFVLSADSDERLVRYVDRVIAFLERGGDPDVDLNLAELAYSSQIGREAMSERIAVVATHIDELLSTLRKYRDGVSDERIVRGSPRDKHEKLEAIVDEAEKNALIRTLIETERLPQLARAWASMLDVDWASFADALYPAAVYSRRPQRMPFPTMPFLTERYWVEEKPVTVGASDVLHPLIDRNLSTLWVQAYRKRFDGQEFYLRDHIVRTDRARKILPGAAYLEMVRAAGELAVDGDGLRIGGIRNLMWMQPFEIVDGPDGLTTRLHGDEHTLRFEISRDSDGGTCVEGVLQVRDADAPREDERLDIASILARGSLIEPGRDEIYEMFLRMGFMFGPSFRITRARYRIAEGALCHLHIPEHLRAGFGDYGMHPALLDAVLRSALAINASEGGQPIVPFALDELEYRHPLTGECYVHVTRSRDAVADSGLAVTVAVPGAEATLYKYDLVVTDCDGHVLVKLHGFTGRVLVKQPQTQARTRAMQYFGYDWAPSPLPLGSDRDASAARTVLVAMRSQALADALACHLPAHHRLLPVLITDADTGAGESNTADRFDPFNADSADRLFASLHARGPMPDAIVYCDDGADADAIAADTLRADALHRGIQAVRRLFVASERTNPGAAVRLLYAFRDDGRAQPQHDAVAGYARSLLTINHRFELSTLGDDCGDLDARLRAIADELALTSGFSGNEIAYRDGRRFRRALHALDTAYAASGDALGTLPLHEGGHYLITGGGGKLGLLIARYLAERTRGCLLLSGRSPEPSASLQREIEALRALGARVAYRSADTSDARAVQLLVDAAQNDFGALHGVIHCAGVASERSILELDDREFAEMLSPKADGLILLDRATAAQPLDFFVCFSSVSALLGDLGSGAYAVGNRFMDSYTLWRDAQRKQNRRNGRSISINWPLWAAGGMEISGADASVFGFSGMQALSEAEGLEAFDKILRGNQDQVLVSVGDPQRVARALRLHETVAHPSARAEPPRSAEPATAPTVQPTPSASISPMPVARTSAMTGAAVTGGNLQSRAEDYVKVRMAAVTKTRAAAIDSQASFEQCGLDSVLLLELHAMLKVDFDGLPKTVLFEYDSAARMVQFLIAQHGPELRRVLGPDAVPASAASASPVPRSATAPQPQPFTAVAPAQRLRAATLPSKRTPLSRAVVAAEGIAIVGIAGEFPASPDLESFWNNLREGRDCIGPIPVDRGFAPMLNRRSSRSGKAIADAGGFIADVDLFDPALFRMTQVEADKLDPQLRVLLRTAWRAVEDAAYTPQALAEQHVGVFVGAMNEDFTWIASALQAHTEAYLGPGAVSSELSNRISFLMNLRGPSLTLSTACSSSLTAAHLAQRAILAGDCEAALVGGVNLSLHHSKYHLLHDMKLLSPDGHERTFDDAANGLVPSEGAGVVVFKRLSRAIADGDHIYGVIRGTRISHSGTGAGQFMPNIRVMEGNAVECIAEAGIAIEDMSYIESHGTGTELGDPIELKALANALRRSTNAVEYCAIGSKANIGHMEAVSGLGSLIKVLLSMRYGEIAPCAKLRRVNASFDPVGSPFFFPQTATAWPKNAKGTRIAGINSFGMGGSNAFIVVESFESDAKPESAAQEPAVFALSARSSEGLRVYVATVAEFLRNRAVEARSPAQFADWAYVTQIGRSQWRHRLALVARDADELLAALEVWLREPERLCDGAFPGDIDAPLAVDTQRLLAGDAGEGFVASLLDARQLGKLAELWARGARIDWAALHRRHPRRRASFPGVPFESVRCDLRHLLDVADASTASRLEPAPTAAIALDAAPVEVIDLSEGGWCRLNALDAGDIALPNDADDDRLRSFWAERFSPTADTAAELGKALSLDVDVDVDDDSTGEGGQLHLVTELVDTELVHTLQAFGRQHGIAIETLVTAAWAVLMNRYTKTRCSQFGLHGASGGEAAPALLPVRVRTAGRLKMLQWLQELQADLLRQHRDALAPIKRIHEWVGHEDPLFDTIVAFDSRVLAGGDHDAMAAAEPISPISANSSHAGPRFELVTLAAESSLELTLIYRARTPDYDKAGILLEQFIVLLEGVVSNPDKMPSALGMRTRAESRERFWKTMEATTE